MSGPLADADGFDDLLNSRISVWKKGGTGVVDAHGFEDQAFTLVAEGIPARIDPGDGKELESDIAFGIQQYTFFMRPLKVDDPPVALNIHHWLQINFVNDEALIDPPDANATKFDIQNIKNPGLLDHHLEVHCKLIEP